MADQDNNPNNDWVYVYGKGVPPLTKARCNVRLLVEERHARFYAAAAKSEQRRAIVDEVMHIVIEHNGGRFQKRHSDGTLLDVEPRVVRAHLQTMFSDKTRVAARRDRQQRLSPVPAASRPTIAEQPLATHRPPAQLKDDTAASESLREEDGHLGDGEQGQTIARKPESLDQSPVVQGSPRLKVLDESAKNPTDAFGKVDESGQEQNEENLSDSSPSIPPPHQDVTDSHDDSLLPNSIHRQVLPSRENHDHDQVPTQLCPRVEASRAARRPHQETTTSITLIDLLPPLPLRDCHVESAGLQSQCDSSRNPLAPNSIFAVLQCRCDNPHCSRTFSVCQFGSDVVCPYCNSENRRMAGAESFTKNARHVDGRGRSSRQSAHLGRSRGGNGAQPHQGNSTEFNNGKTSQNTIASPTHSRCERDISTKPLLAALSNEDEGSVVSRSVNVGNDEDTAEDIIMSEVLPCALREDDATAIEETTKQHVETMTCNHTFMGGLGVLAATAAMTRRDAETNTVESDNSSAADQYMEQERRNESELVFMSGSTKQQATHQTSGESTQSIDVPPLTEREVI